MSYTNQGLKPQPQGSAFGMNMGYRLPVFDIKVSAQRRNVYTKVSQNEMAMQFFKMGFFNPQMVDQAVLCLDMMDFDGKDEILQKISQNGMLAQKLMQYLPLAMIGAQATGNPMLMQQIQLDTQQLMGGAAMPAMPAMPQGNVSLHQSDNISGAAGGEASHVTNARQRANNATQPAGGKTERKAD